MSTIFSTGLIVDRVVAVQIFSRWYSIAISIPDCSSVVSGVQSMRITMFAEPVEIWIERKRCSEIEILTLENQWEATSVEENLPTRSRNGKAERVLCVVESKL
jgi:hypothetical protein